MIALDREHPVGYVPAATANERDGVDQIGEGCVTADLVLTHQGSAPVLVERAGVGVDLL